MNSGEQYLAFDVPNGEKRELDNLLKMRMPVITDM